MRLHVTDGPLIVFKVADIEYPAIVTLQKVASTHAKKHAVSVSYDVVKPFVIV